MGCMVYVRNHFCGNPKVKPWHLACQEHWDKLPKEMQDKIMELRSDLTKDKEHIDYIKECFAYLDEK